ncbi:MAG: HAMP domain-containing sensor histidine kinase [Bacteroidales bacterium]
MFNPIKHITGKSIPRYWHVLITAILLMIFAIILESKYYNSGLRKDMIPAVEKKIHFLQNKTDKIITSFEEKYNNVKKLSKAFNSFIISNKKTLENYEVLMYIYKSDSLRLWSSNQVYVPFIKDGTWFSGSVKFIDRTWFYVKNHKIDDHELVVLVYLKTVYPFDNNYLRSRFNKHIILDPSVEISLVPRLDFADVHGKNGEYLFSLSSKPTLYKSSTLCTITIILYFLSFFLFIWFAYCILLYTSVRNVYLLQGGIFFIFTGLRILMWNYGFPHIFKESLLFDPQYFALNIYVPSLGDLLLNTVLFWSFIMYINTLYRKKTIVSSFHFVLLSLITFTTILIAWKVIPSLILQSTIHILPYKIMDLNVLSLTIYTVFVLIIHTLLRVIHQFVLMCIRNKNYLLYSTLLPGIWGVYVFSSLSNIIFPIFISLLFAIFTLFEILKKDAFRVENQFILIVICSVFTCCIVFFLNDIKETAIKKILAINTLNNQDIVTEHLLQTSWQNIHKDASLKELIMISPGNEDSVNTYLQIKHFKTHLRKYKLEITICGNKSQFDLSNNLSNCETYFKSLLEKYSKYSQDSNFIFISYPSGQTGYFDRIQVINNRDTNILYIELKSRFVSEDFGYPELLLDEDLIPNPIYKQYSFAKYKNGKLTEQKGNYSYPLDISDKIKYLSQIKDNTVLWDNKKHFLYQSDENTYIVVSSDRKNLYNIFVSFSYIFIFYAGLWFLYKVLIYLDKRKYIYHLKFRQKLQLSVLLMLLISLVIVAIGIIYLNVYFYKNTQNEQIEDKMLSIKTEIEQKFASTDIFEIQDYNYLYNYLLDISSRNFTDIHLYNLSGEIIASSRREIFDMGIIGTVMHPEAFRQLTQRMKPKFLQVEKIGELSFTSAYCILINEKNQPLAYLNIPYFNKQDVISERISSLIAAVVNIYVILILISTLFIIFLTGQITKPLKILAEKISKISPDKGNEKITWESKDEIGELVESYNTMVDKLDDSIKKLAEKERETAWREMAKQVAHEIKNPLTPMKLHLQMLLRSWKNKDTDFGERLEKTTSVLIDQIDILASTATEFSDFAKLSNICLEPIDLIERMMACIKLFNDETTIDFQIKYDVSQHYIIQGDKDKITRVFINIVTNAIQAIPTNKKGEIIIEFLKNSPNIVIKISDNGSGIPTEIQDKIFQPNFTTKNSGSGLGLAIVKTIIDLHNGNIQFDTKENIGTTFTISLPEN